MRSVFRLRRLRAVQIVIATTMLVVPASALALSRSTGADTRPTAQLPISVTPRHLHLGQPVAVTGRASTREAGRRVVLQSAPGAGSGWHTIARTRIGRHGRFALHPRLRRSALLRAVEVDARATVDPVAGRSGGASLGDGPVAHIAAASRPAPVTVSAALRVAAREHSLLAGQSLLVAGHVVPARAGRRIALQGHSAHGWRTLAHARTGGRGGFAVRWRRPGAAFERGLRVVFAGDRVNARATAAAGQVTRYDPVVASWYDDAANTGCGFHAGLGVANKSLPCGTKVRVRHGGRSVTATVDDRGPYVAGRDFDLNQNTAAALGFAGVGTVYVSVR